MKKFQKPVPVRLDDPKAERARASSHAAIEELQHHASEQQSDIIENIQLQDGVETPVAHGLGKLPRMVRISVPRGPVTSGRVEEIRNAKVGRDRYVLLKASGYGATITVDVEVR